LGLVLVTLLHAPSLTGGFTSDSLSIVSGCSKLGSFGEWWSWIGRQFVQGNQVVSHFYRPLGNLSLCSDYLLYGPMAGGWRLTQLVIHLLNGIMVYRLTRRLFSFGKNDSIAAPLAALMFWLSPAAPEVSIWIAGRYDGLALLFSLLAIDRMLSLQPAGAALLFAFALLSKESAMVTPGLLLLAAWWAAGQRDSQMSRINPVINHLLRALRYWWPILLIFILYLVVRWLLYDTLFSIYQRGISWPPTVWLSKIPILGKILLPAWRVQPVLYTAFWSLIVALSVLMFYTAIVSKNQRNRFILSSSWLLLTVGALLPHLHQASPVGQGIRLLYAGSAYFALSFAPPLAGMLKGRKSWIRRAGLAITGLTLGFMAVAQYPAQRDWTYAVHYVPRLQRALYAESAHIEHENWALVLVPEHIGVALVGRHGQGALVNPPFQPESLLDRLVPFIGPDLEEWQTKILNGIMYEIRGKNGEDVFWPKYYFCADPRSAGLIALNIEPDPDPAIWKTNWRSAVLGTPCENYLLP